MLDPGTFTLSELAVVVAAAVIGVVSWRSRRGDFYKAVAEEKTAETERLRRDLKAAAETKASELRVLREELEQRRRMTDLTPIVATLERVVQTLERVVGALDQHAGALDETVAKVRDLNGSLKAHTVAVEALADRLVVEEASRAMLETAAETRRRTV